MANRPSESRNTSKTPSAAPHRFSGGNLIRPSQTVDPERIRLAREAELRGVIGKNSDLQSWLEDFGGKMREQQWVYRRHHLASSVRITPRISEKLSGRFDVVRQILGNRFTAEFYVENSAEIGAACSAMPDGSLIVTMTSGAAEKLTASEQLFVLGHEVGHYLLGHHEWPVGAILAPRPDSAAPMCPRLALQLLSWSRCCEISADRFGMLCAQSEAVMARSFLKLASGLPSSLLGSGDDYLSQLDEWKAHRSKDEGCAFTHPLHAIRIHAGQSFWRSAYLDEIFGACPETPASLSAKQADELAAQELAAMDPDPESMEDLDHASLVRAFLAYAGALVVASDGEVDPREIPALVSIADADDLERALSLVRTGGIETLEDEIVRRAKVLVTSTPDETHYRALVQLLVLAYVDGQLAQTEFETLRLIARTLGYLPETVDLIIAQLERGDWSQ